MAVPSTEVKNGKEEKYDPHALEGQRTKSLTPANSAIE
jgi:hypothetical protein